MKQTTLFGIDPIYPEGFLYEPGFISPDEERVLLNEIVSFDLHPFKFQGYEAKRKVASFGYDYSFTDGKLEKGEDIPLVFRPLISRVAARLDCRPEEFAELLLTEYPPGAVINWHRDAPPFDVVAGISLAEDCQFRLRPYELSARTKGATVSLSVARRSLYVMQGAARSHWQHSITPVNRTRYSITLRTLKQPAQGTAVDSQRG